MKLRRANLSLLLAAALLSACGNSGAPAKPDLPASISPGWSLKSYDSSEPPAGLPPGPKPTCWKATYAAAGTADVFACNFAEGAFNALQRANVGADAVKWQSGPFLIVVHWQGVSKQDITALVRSLQKALPAK